MNIHQRILPFLALLGLCAASCSDSTEPTQNNTVTDQPVTTNSVTMKVNGTAWQSMMTQNPPAGSGFVASNGYAVLSLMIVGADTTGDVPLREDGSGGTPYATPSYIMSTGGSYVYLDDTKPSKLTITQKSSTGTRGTFSCTLKTSGGQTVTITDGVFAMK